MGYVRLEVGRELGYARLEVKSWATQKKCQRLCYSVAFIVETNVPFEALIWTRRESMTLYYLSNLLLAETEVLYSPHVTEFMHT